MLRELVELSLASISRITAEDHRLIHKLDVMVNVYENFVHKTLSIYITSKFYAV